MKCLTQETVKLASLAINKYGYTAVAEFVNNEANSASLNKNPQNFLSSYESSITHKNNIIVGDLLQKQIAVINNDGFVFINKGKNISNSTLLKEFSLPFVQLIASENSEVFNNLLDNLNEVQYKDILERTLGDLTGINRDIQRISNAIELAGNKRLDPKTGKILNYVEEKFKNTIEKFKDGVNLLLKDFIEPSDIKGKWTLENFLDLLLIYKGQFDVKTQVMSNPITEPIQETVQEENNRSEIDFIPNTIGEASSNTPFNTFGDDVDENPLNRTVIFTTNDFISDKEVNWFNELFNKEGNRLTLSNLVNSNIWGTWTKAGVTLYANAASGTAYHEGWHEFSQIYLTNNQRDSLYNEALTKLNKSEQNHYNNLNKNDQNLYLEELIAEDFRSFMQNDTSKLIKTNKNIFQKIKEFLINLFKDVTLDSVYKDLKSGNINKYTKSFNSYFGVLNRSAFVFDTLNQDSDKIAKALFDHVDIKYNELAIKNNVDFNDIDSIKAFNKIVFKEIYNNLNLLYNTYQKAGENYNNQTNVLNIIVNGKHLTEKGENSVYNTLINDYIKEKLLKLEDNVDFEFDVLNEDGLVQDGVDSELDKLRNPFDADYQTDSYADASILLKEMFNNLPKINIKNDKFVVEYNEYGLITKADSIQLWKVLLNELSGISDMSKIMNKLNTLKNTYPELSRLISFLGGENTPNTVENYLKRGDFVKTFSRSHVERFISLFNPKKGTQSFTKAHNKSEDFVLQDWKDNFENSLYAYKGINGVKLLTKKLLEDFPFYAIEIHDKTQPIELDGIKNNRIAFLAALGIKFSPSTLNSRELDIILKNQHNEGNFDVIQDLHRWITTMVATKNTINNVIEDMNEYAKFTTEKGEKILGRRKDLKRLINIELSNSSVYFEPSIYNAADKPEYEHQLNNYLTLFSNTLNNLEYKSLNEIFEQLEFEYLNPDKNPLIKNSLVINKMFTKNNDGIWMRNYIKGNPITFNMISYNGLNILKSKEDNINEKGVVTTKMNAFDKMIMDIHNVLSNGVQENIRTGDKASAYAFKMSSWGKTKNGIELRTPISLEEASDISLINVNSKLTEGGNWMRGLLLDEVKRIKHSQINNLKSKVYSKNAGKFVIFDSLITDQIKNELLNIITSSKSIEEAELNAEKYILSDKGAAIKNSIFQYFRHPKTGRAALLQKFLVENGLDLLFDIEESTYNIDSLFGGIQFRNGKQLDLKQIVNSYSTMSFMLNAENMRLVYGDLAFYKDPFKRFSGFSATGVMARTDNETLQFLNNNPNTHKQRLNYLVNNNIDDFNNIEKTNILKTVVFDDVQNVSKFYEDIKNNILQIEIEKGKTKEEAQKYVDSLDILEAYRGSEISDGYAGYTEPDAQGVCTLEWYREASIRTNTWTLKQEKAFVKVLNNEPISLEEMALFPARKDQYTGGVKNSLGIFIPALHKYSLVPLIPQAIVNTPFEKLNNRMLRQDIGYATFASGSKIETLLNSDNKLSKFYNDQGDFNDTNLHTNDIFWKFMKNQVEIAPKMKEENTFGTQYRKLLFQDKFSNGIPVDYNGKDWWNLSLEEKITASPIFKLYNDYNNFLKEITNNELDTLKRELDIKFENGKYTINDWNHLKSLISQEVIRRDLPSSVLNVFKTIVKNNREKAQLAVNNLEASKNKMLVEQLLFSIVNNRLVSQKIFGDALIQSALTGFEKLSDKTKFNEKGYSKDLAFYRRDPNTGKTLPMQIKIAFDINKHLPLLDLEFAGKKIKADTLEQSVENLNNILNTARLDENSNEAKWLKRNEKFFLMVGYRIPTQGLNSIEVMQIVNFLPTTMANTIILPSEIVVSAGSDFDIDKLNVFQYKISLLGDDTPVIYNKPSKDNKNKITYSNRLLDLAVEVLTLKETYEGLVTPNSTNIIKDQIADVVKKKVNDRTNEFNTSKSSTLVLDPLNILEQFNAFLSGKETLGIAALGNTFTQLYQSVGAYLSNEIKLSDGKTRGLNYFLKHSKIEREGNTYIDYSNSFTLDGVKKSELFSQFINAYVDIAKEPFIFYMNAGRQLAPVIFHMINMGTPIMDIANFINQPIIRDYIKLLDRKNSKYLKSALKVENIDVFDRNYKTNVLDLLIEKYDVNNKFKGSYKVASTTGLQTLNKEKEVFESNSSKILESDLSIPLKPKDLTPAQLKGYERQVYYLVQLEELLFQAGLIRDVQGTLNFDTTKTASIIELQQKISNIERFSNNDSIFPKEIYNAIKDTTPIQSYNQNELLSGLLNPLFPLSSSNLVLSNLYQIKDKLKGLGVFDAKVSEKVDKMFYNQMISYIIQNGIMNEDKFINNLFDKYSPMLMGKNNMGLRLNDLKNDFETYMPNTKEERFVNNFVKKESKDSNIVFVMYAGDRLTGKLIDSYEDMFNQMLTFEHTNIEFADKVRTFFNDLMYFSLIQNGIAKTGETFNELIPVNEFNNIVTPLINNFINQINTIGDVTKPNLATAFNNTFVSMFVENNGNIFQSTSSKGSGNFKQYKLNFKGGKFVKPFSVVSNVNNFIEIDPNYQRDLLGGDVPGTLDPATKTLNLYDKTVEVAAKLSSWQNKEAVDVQGISYKIPQLRNLSNEQLFRDGKKSAITLPLDIKQKTIDEKIVNFVNYGGAEYKEGDVIFFGHTFDKYRITNIINIDDIKKDGELLKLAAKKEYVHTWYYTDNNVRGSYANNFKNKGAQLQFEKVYEELEQNFEYYNAYISKIPGEFNRIKSGYKKQLTLEVNRNVNVGEVLVIKQSDYRNSEVLSVIVTDIEEINLDNLFKDTESWENYLKLEANEEASTEARSQRLTISNTNNGQALVVKFKLPTSEVGSVTTTKNSPLRMINIENKKLLLMSDGNVYNENEIVNDEILLNKFNVNKEYQDGTLRISSYNKSTYFVLSDDSIIGYGKSNFGKVTIQDENIKAKILENAINYKKNC